MTNWKGIRTLLRKYGISQKEMLRILETHEVVYSDAAGVILVDEDSLMAYIDALKQLTQKDSLVNVLQKALRSKKKLKTGSTTRGLTQKLSEQVIAINEIVSHALSMLLGETERKIFLAFANQTDIYTIAQLMSMDERVVFVMLEVAITKLSQQSHYWIHKLATKYEDTCYCNQLLMAQAENNGKIIDLLEQSIELCQKQLMLKEEHINYLQSAFEELKEIYKNLEHKSTPSDKVDKCVD